MTRKSGHTYVMDDGDTNGNNQLTRLRTASGHQLLMHDTQGIVYIANASGNAYIEMQANGRIDVYSGVGGINLRTEGDFNLHSDLNINMHANGQIRMSSAKEMIQSADAVVTVGDKAILQSSPAGGIQNYALNSISSFNEALKRFPGIENAEHSCGLGKTFDELNKRYPNKIKPFLNFEDWLEKVNEAK